MQSEKMRSIQNLIGELVSGYVQSKDDEEYLREKIQEILEFILPNIAAILKDKKRNHLNCGTL
ncbi:MAG: hypothetical protein AB1410_00710 [Acidobacteriota bacterium]